MLFLEPNLFLFMHRLGEVDATRAAPALSFPLLIPAPAFRMSLQSLKISVQKSTNANPAFALNTNAHRDTYISIFVNNYSQ
jgi:hypothetical protein